MEGFADCATDPCPTVTPHLLVEADWDNVSPGSSKTLNLYVTPKEAGLFKVRIRAWVTTCGYDNVWRDPTSGSPDQQGWGTHEFTVIVDSEGPKIGIAANVHGDATTNINNIHLDTFFDHGLFADPKYKLRDVTRPWNQNVHGHDGNMGLFSEIKTQLYDPNNPEMMEEEEDDNTWDTSAQIAGVVPQFETLPLLVYTPMFTPVWYMTTC